MVFPEPMEEGRGKVWSGEEVGLLIADYCDMLQLDLLGDELAARDYDMRWFIRELASSETYQRSSELPDEVEDAISEKGKGDLAKLFNAGDTWTVS